MRTFRLFALTVVLSGASLAIPARATVEAWLDVTVPMRHPQGSDVCLRRHAMIGSFGVPMISVMESLITPQLMWNQATGQHEDVNQITKNAAAPIVARYVTDSFNEATKVWSYTMELDVTRLAAARGSSLVGRADTVRRAKLFLVAAADTMGRLSANRFQLRLRFVGLPDQTGLTGTRLHGTTTSPYSAVSTLLARYRTELINAESMCSTGL
jgi:hypothetical protein